jgi:alkylation response protein AidB-like acyl-CoA dehydrogenase
VPATYRLRREDYSLSEEQEAVRDAFRAFFSKTVSAARVRAAEPVGFDPALWQELRQQRVVSMALPEYLGGDGAQLVELALVAEEAGRRAAPVPVVEALVGARALAKLAPTGALLERVRDAGALATVAPGRGVGDRRLIPAGAVAEAVIARRGDDVVALTGGPAAPVANLACAPLGWWDLRGGNVIGSADDFEAVEREWLVLTAAALVGLGQTAVDMGVRYARERTAFGTAIGAFQAIAHPLVDAAGAVEGARRLAWRAAWYADNEPESLATLAVSALLAAADAAEKAGAVTIHTQGGFGVTMESDAQLYYRRAKGWALFAGDRRTLLRRVADLALGPVEGIPQWISG